jgi:hypothetical protein
LVQCSRRLAVVLGGQLTRRLDGFFIITEQPFVITGQPTESDMTQVYGRCEKCLPQRKLPSATDPRPTSLEINALMSELRQQYESDEWCLPGREQPYAPRPTSLELQAIFGDSHQSSPENHGFSGYYFIEAAKGYDGPPHMLSLLVASWSLGSDDPQYLRCEILSSSTSIAQRFKSWLLRRHGQLLAQNDDAIDG